MELWWYSSVFLKYLMAYWWWRPTVIIRGKLPAHALLQFKELWTHILPLGCWVLILLFTFDINFHLDFLNLLHIEALVFWIRLVLFFLEVFFKWFQSCLGRPQSGARAKGPVAMRKTSRPQAETKRKGLRERAPAREDNAPASPCPEQPALFYTH